MDPKKLNQLRTRRDFIRQAACAAVGTTALSGALRDLRLINAAVAAGPITNDYKALVCVFLNGGNDSNNLIIPTIPAEYASYSTIRTSILAIPNTDGTGATALALNPTISDGHTYGIHPACPGLQNLFNTGKAATMFNVGSLVYPITRAQYTSGTVKTPPQLFSHSDQQQQWQTSLPDKPATTGWGGRLGDLITNPGTYNANPSGQISFAATVAGTNIWQRGISTDQYSLTTSGAVDLASPGTTGNPGGLTEGKKNALLSMMGVTQTSLQGKAYAAAMAHALSEAGIVNNSISTTNFDPDATAATNVGGLKGFVATSTDPLLALNTPLFPTQVITPNGGSTFTSSLSAQLKMIARLIEAGSRQFRLGQIAGSTGMNMQRQIFFVQVGGYDTHTNQTNTVANGVSNANVVIGSQANLFAELSRSLYGFQRAMEILGLSNRVTAFTVSDFGRTFPSTGQGSDHGWGSHHFVVGGAVNGQKTYGKWPTLTVNGPDDTSTGRWIPTTSVDQYCASFATWFGVGSTDLATIFPNLSRFATPPTLVS